MTKWLVLIPVNLVILLGFEADPFGGKSTRGPGDLGLGDKEFLGLTFNRFNEFIDFSFPELIADVVDVVNPFAGF